MTQIIQRPALVLLTLALMCLAICAGGIWFAVQQPGLGLSFKTDAKGVVLDSMAPRHAGKIPVGARLSGISDLSGSGEKLTPQDLVEDPDMLDDYPAMAIFFARQERLSRLIRSKEVRLTWVSDAKAGSLSIQPQHRILAELPVVFWYQMLVGVIGFVIAAWVYALRPGDMATGMFLVTGLGLFASSFAAALYSTRELALPGEIFQLLSLANHGGAVLFGCAFVALFASYPQRLVAPRHLLWLPLVFGAWLMADSLRWMDGPNQGVRAACMVQMLLALFFSWIQWRRSRERPLDRASLRWLLLSTMIACTLVTLNGMVAVSLAIETPISQGYTFGFFLIMYLGIALGLGKYRLFDLDEWAYRILLWLAGTAAIVLGDIFLIWAGFNQTASLGLSLLLVGGLYFPFRQWLWQRLVTPGTTSFETLLPQLSSLAFLASPSEQSSAWDSLLRQVFEPLKIQDSDETHGKALLRQGGLDLYLPPCHGLKPRILSYAGRGYRLFSTRDALFADTLAQLLQKIMAGRVQYEQGVEQERLRISRDLHDNIGARLLKLIHHLRGSAGADLARDAMKDLRTAIAAMDTKPTLLADALADWHAESEARCEAAGVSLLWQQDEMPHQDLLSPRAKAMLESVLRELVSNALKHATPGRVTIQVDAAVGSIRVCVENDGDVGDPNLWKPGYGLRNIRGRLAEFGGGLFIRTTASGVSLCIETPLRGQE